jgi:hypothetical protein
MEIQCKGTAAEIYSKVKPKLQHYKDAGKLQIKDVDFSDSKFHAIAKGTGFKAIVQCKDGGVSVDLDLGLLLKPLRSTIEDSIRESVERVLA